MKKLLLVSLCVLVLCVTQVFAQNRTVTGTVTAKDDGLPIPGATVKIKGTDIGVATDASGKFSLSAPDNAVLTISFVAYTPQEVSVAGKSVVNVTLTQNYQQLSEVVVTSQGIARERRSLGYSAPTISGDVLVQGGNASALTSLTGRIPGANITSTSNTPGSSTRIVFRGGTSVAGNNQALIVVDGVPVDNSSVTGGADSRSSVDFGNRANDIDPDDIESITPLLGPGAAALYGSRAANGAIQIVTKSGKKGKTTVSFNTSNVFSSILRLPEFQNEYGQGYINEFDANGVPDYGTDTQENWSWGRPFDGKPQAWGQAIDVGSGTPVKRIKNWEAQKNNVRDFFVGGFATDNNVNFSGGNDKSTFFMALNTLNSDGVYPGNQDVYNKYGVRFNGKTDFSDKFTAGISFNYNKISSRQVAGGQNDNSVFDMVLQTPRDIPLPQLKDLTNPYNAFGFTDYKGVVQANKYGYYGSYTLNPYFVLDKFSNDDELNRITGNVNLEYKPTTWLNVTDRLGIDTYSERRRVITPKYSFTPVDAVSNGSTQVSNGGYEIDQYGVTELNNDFMVTAKHSFSSDFKGSLLVGNNIRQRNTYTLIAQTNASAGLVVPNWYNLANSNGPVATGDSWTVRRIVGLYADLNLSYKNFLFLEATGRNDWSSTLPKANNSFFYPSVNTSFAFSELIGTNSILSSGKVRASWAQVGNDTDPYRLLTTFAKGTVTSNFGSTLFPFGNVAALQAGATIGNPNLKPEITTAMEIGTDLSFFDSRFGINFTYYEADSKNQILSVPIPNSTGYGAAIVNAGRVKNHGVELALTGTVVRSSNINVELFATYTQNRNIVMDLPDGVDQITIGGFGGMGIVAAKNRLNGQFYGITNQTDAQGRTIVSATTGIPLKTTVAQYLGSYNPKYQGSFGGSITFKRKLNVNFLFDTKQGGKMYSRTKDILAFVGVSKETGGVRYGQPFPNSVYISGGNTVVNTGANAVNYSKQDYFSALAPGQNIIDASYVKLRSAGISYTFAKSDFKSLPFNSVSVGVFGNNLFMWTPKSNAYIDPEINSGGATNEQGLDFTAQPSVRNYGFNVRVTF
ncbi:SusC/RagA family TonB-linked outer membrane protein [Mucilaginibacter calamicampi]|uniref:SusC/RagA family TonB-linked outer membrane protein n=1 Tax=Mucilaginibacter calamicampi TaxID=1302352 RepID=A0ABW2Z279_9SPHI